MISIIIPTLNEATQLPGTLQAVAKLQGDFEIIAVDGGSTDGTVELLRQYRQINVILLNKTERAAQMNAGAQVAGGEIFWFLHADTLVPPESLAQIEKACRQPGTVGGSFRMVFDREEWYYRLLAWFTCFNSRWWTFGDQGIFARREVFHQLSGYADMPMLEDLDFQIRLRRTGRFVKLSALVITSARRYRHGGFCRQIWRDTFTVLGYLIGSRIEYLK